MPTTVTGSFWNVDDPLKPWGLFDPDDAFDFPCNFADWLADSGTSYAGHTVTPDPELEHVTSTQSAGEILVRIRASGTPAVALGTKYAFTVQVTDSAGQKKSKTFRLKMKEL